MASEAGLCYVLPSRMLSLFLVWPALFLLILGCGALLVAGLQRAGGPSFARPIGTLQTFWFGYGSVIACLQLLSLVAPIRRPVLYGLSALSLCGFVVARRVIAARLRSLSRHPRWLAGLALAAVLIALLMACHSAGNVVWFDTHLYHLQVVRWVRKYPAVRGIANLHFRLAYNNSVHLFDAVVDLFQTGRAAHISRGFLCSVSLIQLTSLIITRSRHPRARLAAACAIIMVPFVLSRASLEVASLSTDLPFALLTIVMVLELFLLRPAPRGRSDLQLALILLMAAVALTTKLSALPVLLAAGGFTLWHLLRGRFSARRALVIGAIPALLLVGFFARQAVLSGWLFFPAVAGDLHLPWSLPIAQVDDQNRWIQSWARVPGPHHRDVLDHGFLHWFMPWCERYKQAPEVLIVQLSLAAAVLRLAGPRLKRFSAERAVLALALLGMAFWFRSAPDPRFGQVYFWSLLAAIAGPMLAVAMKRSNGQRLALAMGFWLCFWSGGLNLVVPPVDALVRMPAIPDAPVEKKRVSPDLEIYVPKPDLCSNGPLPCTPLPANQRPIRKGDLGAGFLW